MDWMSLCLALCMGIALSAACGLRVFLPLLVVAACSRCGLASVSDEMAWLGSDVALLCLSAATVLELAAYYMPWLDNALDAVQGPLAVLAGALVMTGVLAEQPDWLQWGVGLVAGAGTAGGVKLLASALRLGSTATTGGLANWILSTLENIGAFIGSLLALVAPVLAVAGLLLLVYLLRRRICRKAQPA